MEAPVKDTVKVNITNQTPRISEVGFGTLLIMGKPTNIGERTKIYSEPSEMLDDGFKTTDEIYKKALVAMSQDRTPGLFMIGKRNKDANTKQKVIFSPAPTEGTFTVEVGGQTTAAITYDAEEAAIKAAMELLSTVDEVIVSRTLTSEFDVEFVGTNINTLVEPMNVIASEGGVSADVEYITYGSADEEALVAYNAIKESSNDFYGVVFTSDCLTDDEAVELASTLQTEERHGSFIRTTSLIGSTDLDADSNEIATRFKKLNLTKVHCIYTKKANNFIDAAIMGLQLTKTPGSSSFMYKTLRGVETDEFTTTERSNLRTKSCNYYERQSGLPVFKDGVVPTGEFIDISIGIDFLTVRMGEIVFVGIATPEKVDYDGGGLSVIESLMLSSLYRFGVDNNLIIAESIVIIMPDIDIIPILDKANRRLKNCKFKALLKGAIHTVEIDGVLTV